MKIIFRLFMSLATLAVAVVAMIKYVKNVSWRDAVGILEELFKEVSDTLCSEEAEEEEEKEEG